VICGHVGQYMARKFFCQEYPCVSLINRYREDMRTHMKRSISTKLIRGFTLIELLIVVTILGIFLALAYPQVEELLGNTRGIRCESRLEMIQRAKTSYSIDNLLGQRNFSYFDIEDLPDQATGLVPAKEDKKSLFRMYFMEPFAFVCPASMDGEIIEYEGVYDMYGVATCPNPNCGGGAK